MQPDNGILTPKNTLFCRIHQIRAEKPDKTAHFRPAIAVFGWLCTFCSTSNKRLQAIEKLRFYRYLSNVRGNPPSSLIPVGHGLVCQSE